jgi:hypothetical protein
MPVSPTGAYRACTSRGTALGAHRCPPLQVLSKEAILTQTFTKMKLSLAILVVFSAVCFAAPIISTANKVVVNFYMESL